MARTADHDARKRQVADAVRNLMPEVGFDRVTIAKVAARAGISVGLVQHYFPTKDDVLLHTYREVVSTTRARIDERIADGDRRERPIRRLLRDAFAEALPLDERRRTEYRISQAFLGRTFDRPDLARVAAESAAGLRAEVATAVENGKKCGEVDHGTDSGQTALELLAMLDGLAARVYHEAGAVVGDVPVREAVSAIIRERLAQVFSGECGHHKRQDLGGEKPDSGASPSSAARR